MTPAFDQCLKRPMDHVSCSQTPSSALRHVSTGHGTRGIACRAYRMRQYLQRPELQRMIQEQYREDLLQDAVDDGAGRLTFRLQSSTPAAQAAMADTLARAQLNRALRNRIQHSEQLQQLEEIMQQHSQQLDFMTVSLLAINTGRLTSLWEQRAAAGSRGAAGGAGGGRGGGGGEGDRGVPLSDLVGAAAAGGSAQAQAADGRLDPGAAELLLQLVLRALPWYTARQFAQTATGLAAAGLGDTRFWSHFTDAPERKLLSFSATQLAQLVVAVASSGVVPSHNWLTKAEGQATKHWGGVGPAVAAALLWSWGRLNYTPQKRLLDSVKRRVGSMLRLQLFGPEQLLQALYGAARLRAHHPKAPWLDRWCLAFQPYMLQVTPEVLVDVLFCLVSLQHCPPEPWTAALLQAVQDRGLAPPSFTPLTPPSPHEDSSHNQQFSPTAQASTSTRDPKSEEGLREEDANESMAGGQAAWVGERMVIHFDRGADQASVSSPGQREGWGGGGVDRGGVGGEVGQELPAASVSGYKSLRAIVGDGELSEAEELLVMGGEEEEGVGEEEEVGEEEGGEGEGAEQDVREEVEEGEEEEEEESFLDTYPHELYPETLGEAADPDPDPDLDPDLDPGAGRKEASQHSHKDTTHGQGGQQVRQQGFWPRLSPLAAPGGPGLLVPSLALASPLISHQAWAARQRAGRATPLSGPHLAQLAWALGAAGLRPGPLFVTAFCRQVADSRGGMDGNALADVLAALPSMLPPPSTPPPANLDHTPSHLDNDLPHLASSLKDFESQAWEEAHACIEEVCGVICERCMECLPDMEPDAVAKVLLSLVRLNCPPPPGLLPLVTSTTASQLAAYSAWSLPDVLLACAHFGHQPPSAWWSSLAVEWQRLCSQAPPSRLARLAWALARLRVKLPPALMHDLLVAARAQFKVMEDNDLVSIVWSLASLRHRPGPLWLSALCQESRARLAQWPAHSLVEVMWALALFSHTPPPEWLQAVEVVLVDRLPRMTPHQAAVVCWCMQQWRHVPSVAPHMIPLTAAALFPVSPHAHTQQKQQQQQQQQQRGRQRWQAQQTQQQWQSQQQGLIQPSMGS